MWAGAARPSLQEPCACTRPRDGAAAGCFLGARGYTGDQGGGKMAKTKKPSANSNGPSKGGANGGGGGSGGGGNGSFGLVPMLSVAVACFAVGYGFCSSTTPAPTRWFTTNVEKLDVLGTLPPNAKIITVSIEPPIQLIKGFLSPSEVQEIQGFFMRGWEGGRFRDVSKRGERNTSHMWLPVDNELRSTSLQRVDRRISNYAMIPVDHIENGYFARYLKPLNGEFVSLHNDNSDAKMAELPRAGSFVIFVNTPEHGHGLTVFPLAKPLKGPDPTTRLNKYMTDTRAPPPGATGDPQPYWRFLDTDFDYRKSDRDTPAKEAAWQVIARARELCDRGTMANGLEVEEGDAVFFKSLHPDGSIDTRAIHASCPNTGDK
mmetsp:Transcript_91553/g.261675  ORF Transcript_91553/g.261675 Transcript_91553/m.261675 type:complete len:375 (+) Transcript_91553:694-1818(+)